MLLLYKLTEQIFTSIQLSGINLVLIYNVSTTAEIPRPVPAHSCTKPIIWMGNSELGAAKERICSDAGVSQDPPEFTLQLQMDCCAPFWRFI